MRRLRRGSAGRLMIFRTVRLLETLRFAYEGRLRAHITRDGERRDCLIYGRQK